MNWQQIAVLVGVLEKTTGSDPLLQKIHQAARIELQQLVEDPIEEEED